LSPAFLGTKPHSDHTANLRERVNAGLRAARERGVKLGRPGTNGVHGEAVRRLRAQGKGIRAIARELRLPVASVHKLASCDAVNV